jgi:MYXO-CTERM domain-containing protein
MTVASFIDIGFTGVESVPEPGSCLLASLGLGGLVLRGRRRHREKNTA